MYRRSPFGLSDFLRPRPRTLFSPNDSIAPKKLSMTSYFRDENEDELESSAESVVPEVVGDVVEPLYDTESWTLPTLPQTGSDAVTRVSCETIYQLVRGHFKDNFDEYKIVDCRYDYEHDGGHIAGAISINRKEQVSHFFEQMRARAEDGAKVVIVFHCEYSQHRGPRSWHYFRSLDRKCNSYPHLSFPDLYVMDGGYRAFFSSYGQQCQPMCYVSMDDPVSQQCIKEIAKCRRTWNDHKSSRKRSRSRLPLSAADEPTGVARCLSFDALEPARDPKRRRHSLPKSEPKSAPSPARVTKPNGKKRKALRSSREDADADEEPEVELPQQRQMKEKKKIVKAQFVLAAGPPRKRLHTQAKRTTMPDARVRVFDRTKPIVKLARTSKKRGSSSRRAPDADKATSKGKKAASKKAASKKAASKSGKITIGRNSSKHMIFTT